eukprot:sb/3465066/
MRAKSNLPNTISWLAGQSNNLLWVIPGGVLTDSKANTVKEVFDEWLLWLQIVDVLTCCVPLVAAPSELDLSLDEELFHYFLPQPVVAEKTHWYSFDHRNMHMVVTCAHCDLNTTSPQYRWLNSDLKASSERSGVHWTTLIGHESRHDQGGPGKAVLDELASEYNVEFAMWSHERWYERSQPMREDKVGYHGNEVTSASASSLLVNVNGTIHYTCGTGGSPLSSYNMTKYNDSAYFEQRYYGACVLQRVSYSTYDSVFFYVNPAKNNAIEQTDFIQTYCFRWLTSDLKASSERSGVHWTTLIGHESRHDQGGPGKAVLDELASEYNVEFAMWSHERWYERSQPMREDKVGYHGNEVTSASASSLLVNVNGTIHYTCGTGGSPLSSYNMTKYNDSAYFEQRYIAQWKGFLGGKDLISML